MKNLLVLLGLVIATAIPGWTADEVDPRELGRKLLGKIDQLHTQYVAIDGMIGDGKPYAGLATKPIQSALTLLAGSAEANDIDFLAALNDCRIMEPALNLETTTLETLLDAKRKNIDAIVRFIESMGVNIAELREEAQAERLAAAAKAIDTAPSQAELFREDLYGNSERAKLVLLHLTRFNLSEFVDAQNAIRNHLREGQLTSDERLKAIFSTVGRQYRSDDKYLWFALIDILSENIPGVNPDNVDDLVKKLGYQDTWAINGHFQGTHNKKTPDAVRSYKFDREGSRLGVGRDVTRGLARLAGKFGF